MFKKSIVEALRRIHFRVNRKTDNDEVWDRYFPGTFVNLLRYSIDEAVVSDLIYEDLVNTLSNYTFIRETYCYYGWSPDV